MTLKIYKPALLVTIGLLVLNTLGFAQSVIVKSKNKHKASITATFSEKEFEAKMNELGDNLSANLKDLGKNLTATINNFASNISVNVSDDEGDKPEANTDTKINLNLGNLLSNLKVSVNNDDDKSDEPGNDQSLKVKNYSKRYPLDGNDRIKLSNQYGKITVNTWDKHEVKVDIHI